MEKTLEEIKEQLSLLSLKQQVTELDKVEERLTEIKEELSLLVLRNQVQELQGKAIFVRRK